MSEKIKKSTNGKKNNFADILTAVLVLAVIFGFAAAFVIKQTALPEEVFSEQENRYLAGFPKLSSYNKKLDRLIDGRFTEEFGDFYTDRFPLRDSFTGLAAASEILLLKGESNGVKLLSDGKTLVMRRDGFDKQAVSENINSLSVIAQSLAAEQIPLKVYFAKRGIGENEDLAAFAAEECGRAGIDFSLGSVSGETPLYYRTDHHWNTEGAYRGYLDIAELLSVTPYGREDFTVETVSRDFYGTLWSKACMKWVEADSIELWRYSGDDSYKVTIADTGESFWGFYDFSYLDKKDKYSLFLSGNNARTDIVLEGEERETLLILKDSFAHSVVPFLSRHFDITLIDPRYYKGSAASLVKEINASYILVLCDIYSLSDYKELFALAAAE